MKRLTIRNSDGTVSQPTDLDWGAALRRLAAYEDTGFTPREVEALKNFCNVGMPVLRFVEIVSAESENRLVVLPCKVGDTVWRIVTHRLVWSGEEEKYIMGVPFHLGMFDEIGKTVFLTRAEAALVVQTAKTVAD